MSIPIPVWPSRRGVVLVTIKIRIVHERCFDQKAESLDVLDQRNCQPVDLLVVEGEGNRDVRPLTQIIVRFLASYGLVGKDWYRSRNDRSHGMYP